MRIENHEIIIENKRARLILGEDAVAKSLVSLETGEELLNPDELIPFCSITEERPFNNEIKLAHPNKWMRFNANRVRLEENRLYIGFELVKFEAIVEVSELDDYVTFKVAGFNVPRVAFGTLCMDTPPVESFRFIQLPVKKRERIGEWLNAVSDDRVAVGVLATSMYEDIDMLKNEESAVLCATALHQVKMKGCCAALVVSSADKFLDTVSIIENDFDLPRGVESRRDEHINRSALWTHLVNPTNVDRYIALAKSMGMTHFLIYYEALFKQTASYSTCGNYDECDYWDTYPDKDDSLREMLSKIKAAGITPGIHLLQTHIGVHSRYVTPVCDHRIRLKQYLTLAKPIGKDDTTIYVEENPHAAPMADKCRILRFGGELISYEGYTTEYPYCFTGCQRGFYKTNVTSHEMGQIGGVVDVSEFTATSFYLDQDTSLQDEIADKLARIYDCGFEFIYFDGSEGTSAPFNINVSKAQYRVIKKLKNPPLFCEGAAKTHFGWHFMSGGNAFDVFPAPVFKEKIVEHPFEEAPRMAQDFTRLNFGWWRYGNTMLPDHFEYGNALALSYDCPITIMFMHDLTLLEAHPRHKDNIEVFRRWEDVRVNNLLSEDEKLSLRNTAQEHTLLIDEEGKYELVPYNRVVGVAGGSEEITAYTFERNGKSCAVLFHNTGSATIRLPLSADSITYEDEVGGNKIPLTESEGYASLVVDDKHYLSTNLDMDTLVSALKNAKI